MIEISAKIQTRSAHIPELGWLAMDHATFMITHAEDHVDRSSESIFVEEAQTVVRTQEATYDWFILFNIRLSILCSNRAGSHAYGGFFVGPYPIWNSLSLSLVSQLWADNSASCINREQATKIWDEIIGADYEKNPWQYGQPDQIRSTDPEEEKFSTMPIGRHITDQKLRDLMNFDETKVRLFPSIKGELTIHDLNCTYGSSIWILGIVPKPMIADDLGRLPPIWFFSHDFAHLTALLVEEEKERTNPIYSSKKTQPLFSFRDYFHPIYEKFYAHLTKLNDPQKIAEGKIWYFMISHENNSLSMLTRKDFLTTKQDEFKEKIEFSKMGRMTKKLLAPENQKAFRDTEYINSFCTFFTLLRNANDLPENKEYIAFIKSCY